MLEESREACAPVLGLRKELAAAEAAERLKAQLAAGRAQLAAVAVAGLDADPQASALTRLIGAEEATIRTGHRHQPQGMRRVRPTRRVGATRHVRSLGTPLSTAF